MGTKEAPRAYSPVVVRINEACGEEFFDRVIGPFLHGNAKKDWGTIYAAKIAERNGRVRTKVPDADAVRDAFAAKTGRWALLGQETSELMQLAQLEASFLVHTRAATDAYRLLLDGIGKLAELERARTASDAQDQADVRPVVPLLRGPGEPTTGIRSLEDLFLWLMDTIGAGCARVYVWDRLLNRPRHVWGRGLRLMEFAIASSLRNPVPRMLLLDVAGRGPVLPLTWEELNRDDPGSFCSREGVCASVAVLLTPTGRAQSPTGGERLLLFLNFRTTDAGLADGDTEEARNALWEFTEEKAKTLQLFVRYLNGWLERKAIEVPRATLALEPGAVATAAATLAAGRGAGPTRGAPLPPPTTIADTLAALFRPVTAGGAEPQPLGATVSLYDVRDGEALLAFDREFGVNTPNAGDVRLVIADRKRVRLEKGSSFSGQTLAWKRAALIDLDRPLDGPEMGQPAEDWAWLRSLHVPRSGPMPRREAVAPIVFEGERLGAISIQEDAPVPGMAGRRLDQDALELLEAFAAAVAGMWNLRGQGAPPPVEMLERGLASVSPGDVDGVLRCYAEAVRAACGTDFAYVVLYDSVLGFCRPRGISAHEKLCSMIWSERLRLPGPLPPELSEAIAARDRAIGSPPGPDFAESASRPEVRAQLVLLTRAMAIDLLPRRDGLSWQIFTSGRAEGWDSIRDREDPFWAPPPYVLSTFSAAAVGKPFRCQPSADALGVVWTGLMRDGTNAKEQAHRIARARGSVLEPGCEPLVEAMTNAVASLIALLKFRGFDRQGNMRSTD